MADFTIDSDYNMKLIEDERRYLRALWDYPDRLNDSKVKPKDFCHATFGLMMQAMLDLHNSGAALEELELLLISPNIDRAEFKFFLRTTGMVQNLKLYEDRIVRDSIRRRLRTAGMKIKEVAENGSNISEDITTASRLLEGIDSGEAVEDFTGEDMARQFRDEMVQGPDSSKGILTHLPKLNRLTGGFRPGEFVVIGAFTNDGKSALKMNFAIHAATHGHSVGIISLEDSVTQYRNRMLSYLSGVNSRILRDRNKPALLENQSMALLGAEEALSKAQLIMAYKPGMSMADIEGKARFWVKKYGIEMLVVDYIQIIENPGFHIYRERVMDTVMRLTSLCRNLGIVLLTSSQINRDGEKEPSLAHLAETSKIEHQADYAFLIEAKKVPFQGEEIRVPIGLRLAKGRDVAKGMLIDIEFIPDRMALAEQEPAPSPQRIPLVVPSPPSWREPELAPEAVAEDTERRTGS